LVCELYSLEPFCEEKQGLTIFWGIFGIGGKRALVAAFASKHRNAAAASKSQDRFQPEHFLIAYSKKRILFFIEAHVHALAFYHTVLVHFL
jgi:hypothetical protein